MEIKTRSFLSIVSHILFLISYDEQVLLYSPVATLRVTRSIHKKFDRSILSFQPLFLL